MKIFEGLEVTAPWIGTFNHISINGNTSFPYLDIQLSWTDAGKIRFNVYRKPGKYIKYLNTNSHHHKNHKMAAIQGVELFLALLKTVSKENKTSAYQISIQINMRLSPSPARSKLVKR
jgi:hypothetical protein